MIETPKLSIVMPGIRREKWPAVYDSISTSFSGSWELLICGPYAIEADLRMKGNVRGIIDFGSPMRCHQKAFAQARGEFVGWALDDGIYQSGMIDEALKLIDLPGAAVTSKYFEGDGETGHMEADDYYYLKNHALGKGLAIPEDYVATCGPIWAQRNDVLAIGGWDCRYETVSVGYLDFGFRLQASGVRVILQDGVAVRFSHQPGRTGDHGPCHDGFVEHDEPMFRALHRDVTWKEHLIVTVDNWEAAPSQWDRRFGKK